MALHPAFALAGTVKPTVQPASNVVAYYLNRLDSINCASSLCYAHVLVEKQWRHTDVHINLTSISKGRKVTGYRYDD